MALLTVPTACTVLSVLTVLTAPTVQAQIRASERATLSQTIDGTVISLDYARPRLRGRSPIFGKVVKWGELWTPGANWATTLEASKPIALGGQAVAKGKAVMVTYDYASSKPMPVPDWCRARIEEYEGRNLSRA